MGTIAITNFTGALEGVADTDYRLLDGGARVTSPWNRHAVDANTVFCYRMDEPAWNGTAGEVIDAGPGGLHATAQGSANTAAGALERYGDMGVASDNDHVLTPTIAWPSDTFCLEFWAYVVGSPNQGHSMLGTGNSVNRPCELRVNSQANPTNWQWRGYGRTQYFNCANDAWVHWTLQASKSANNMRAWLNGQNVLNTTAGTGAAGNITFGLGKAVWALYGADVWMDDVRLSNVARRATAANFAAPTWLSAASLRTSASTVDSQAAGSTWSQLVTTVATVTGDETYAVYIAPSESATVPDATSGDWQLIGSGYTTGQTLPISGTGRYCHTKIVTGASTGIGQYAVELDGLEWTYTPAASYIPRRIIPARLGPRLLPIGGLV
jgi:hypothetical protein